MQYSIYHLLAKYRVTDVTPKNVKITRQEGSHMQAQGERSARDLSSPRGDVL